MKRSLPARKRPIRRAWVAALALGLIGGILQGFAAPILTEESPLFTWWQAPVLFAFVVLGPWLGLAVAAIALAFDLRSLAELWQIHPGVTLGAVVYVLEAAVAWWLYRRLRSLPMASAIFWISFGWIFDLVVYVLWVGLEPDYVAMLFVKQILNGLLCASIVDLLAAEPVRRFVLGRGERVAFGVEQYAFRGFVVLAMLPLATVGVLYARAQYAEVLQNEEQTNSELAFDLATDLRQTLEAQVHEARNLLRRLDATSSAEERRALLREHLQSNEGIIGLASVDENGVIDLAEPAMGVGGRVVAGNSFEDRAYFRQVKESLQTTYSGYVRGRIELRAGQGDTAVIAEPWLGRGGEFSGALLWAIDLERILAQVAGELGGRDVTLIDGSGSLLVSTIEERVPGSSSADVILDAGQVGAEEPRPSKVVAWDQRMTIFYYPRRDAGISSQLGLDPIHAVNQPVTPPGWSVLVDLSAGRLHERFRQTALHITALFLALVSAVYLVIKRFARRITDPVRSAAAVAEQVKEGTLYDDAPLRHMRSSDLQEMRRLGLMLEELDQALQLQRRETAEREEDLQHKLSEAQKMEAVGLLAGGVAHDFNNMLTPILGYADLGCLTATTEEERQYFQHIQRSAKEAAKVTSQLLAFGRRQVLDMESVDLVNEIEQCPGLLRPLLREDIELRIAVDVESAPALVDPAQFHRILFNLALNAQDAMSQGGVLTVSLASADAAPSFEEPMPERGFSQICVEDNGCGMSSEVQRQIFEPFFSTKGPERGTGLGLASVYGIVRQHGGSVHVESVEGEGTKFCVFLPVVEETAAEEVAEQSVLFDRNEEISVLLVEDDGPARDVVTSFLSRAGFKVSAFANAETLFETFRTAPDAVDAVITDVVLPGMNGRELFDRIQELKPGFPILFISGYGHDVLALQGLPEGSQLLSKPFTQRKLVDSLLHLLRDRTVACG